MRVGFVGFYFGKMVGGFSFPVLPSRVLGFYGFEGLKKDVRDLMGLKEQDILGPFIIIDQSCWAGLGQRKKLIRANPVLIGRSVIYYIIYKLVTIKNWHPKPITDLGSMFVIHEGSHHLFTSHRYDHYINNTTINN